MLIKMSREMDQVITLKMMYPAPIYKSYKKNLCASLDEILCS